MQVVVVAPGTHQRVPVLQCADALRAQAEVEILGADSDTEVDAALDKADERQARLVVAGGDGPLRAVIRRMARRVTPAPSKRPADLPADRTMPDLPPVGLLPLEPGDGPLDGPSLAAELCLPHQPAAVAAAVLGGKQRRIDLFRNDGGSVTVHGALLGAATETGQPLTWRAQVDVDDKNLSAGDEPIFACAVANAGGYARLDGLSLLHDVDASDGYIRVAVATHVAGKPNQIEVRRAAGRAVTISPTGPVPFTDDGVDGELTRGRSWWIERSAWGIYVPQ